MSLSYPALHLWMLSGLEILSGHCVAFWVGGWRSVCVLSNTGVPPIGPHGIVDTARGSGRRLLACLGCVSVCWTCRCRQLWRCVGVTGKGSLLSLTPGEGR